MDQDNCILFELGVDANEEELYHPQAFAQAPYNLEFLLHTLGNPCNHLRMLVH